MKKKFITAVLLVVPLFAYATEFESKTTITPNSFNISELSVTSLNNMNIPAEIKQQIVNRKNEEREKGYFETDSDYAQFLLKLDKNAPIELKNFQKNTNAADTHLKSNLKDIKLAFNFNTFANLKPENIIGYAPVGSYIKSDPIRGYKEGWTGLNTYFKDSFLGVCSYSFFNLKASNGAVQLNSEFTEYEVNKKPSSYSVEGNLKSGFLYELHWFEVGKMHQLSCANKIFDKNIMPKMIWLAENIDKE